MFGEAILTNFVAGGVAGVSVELQGRLSLVRALFRNLGFDVLRVGTAQGSQVGGVGRGARAGMSAPQDRDRNVSRGATADYCPKRALSTETTHPMTDRRQAGVWPAETRLAKATKARARVDLLKNMVKWNG